MTSNLLSLNSSKTEFLLIGPRQQFAKIHNPSTSIDTTHSARNLGFIFDEHLSFFDQISARDGLKALFSRQRQRPRQKARGRGKVEAAKNLPRGCLEPRHMPRGLHLCVLVISLCFSYSYVRQTKLTSSLVNF